MNEKVRKGAEGRRKWKRMAVKEGKKEGYSNWIE